MPERMQLFIPGIGPVLVTGPLVSAIIGPLEGAVVAGGFDAIGAVPVEHWIPKESVLKYESSLKANKFLLVAHGMAAEVAKANDIIQTLVLRSLCCTRPDGSNARALMHIRNDLARLTGLR